jgi:hypothetical protein
MNTVRFNGVPIDLDSLSPGEFANLVTYTHDRADKALGEYTLLKALETPDNVVPFPVNHDLPPDYGGAA